MDEEGKSPDPITRYEAIYHYVFRCLRNPEDAEDVTQEAMMRLFQKRHLWDEGRGTYQSWANQVARRVLVDWIRRNKKRRVGEVLVSDIPEGEEELSKGEAKIQERMIDWERLDWIRERIAQLPLNFRKALRIYLTDLTIAEASELMAIPPNTYKIYVYRAKQVLREQARRCRDDVTSHAS